jgi:hypothetical protein
MVAAAVIVYFLAAEWSPCHRGRQALIVFLLFNLWSILPLGGSSDSNQRSPTLASNVSIPFWSPPPLLSLATTAARSLMSAGCFTFPSVVMRAKVIPDGKGVVSKKENYRYIYIYMSAFFSCVPHSIFEYHHAELCVFNLSSLLYPLLQACVSSFPCPFACC